MEMGNVSGASSHVNQIQIINKPIVSVKNAICCKKKRVQCKRRRRASKRVLVIEEICGNIFQRCKTPSQTYWRSEGVSPSGTIKIANISRCPMVAKIVHNHHRTTVAVIEEKQQVAFTVNRLEKLKVRFRGNKNMFGNGNYAMDLHYRI